MNPSLGTPGATRGVEQGTVPGCLFCPDLRFSVNRKAELPAEESVLIEDDDFFVAPDLAPLVVGHVLIVSKRHVPSMRDLDPARFAGLERIAAEVADRYREKWGAGAVILEHGATYPGSAGACIDHAHWHCVPDYLPIHEALQRRGMAARTKRCAHLREQLSAFRQPYLLVRHNDQVVIHRNPDVPCQFLRWIVADAAQSEQWLWGTMYETADSRNKFMQTLSELSTHPAVRTDEVVRT